MTFLSELKEKLLIGSGEQSEETHGSRYNIPRINALVLYVGAQALSNRINPLAPLAQNGPDFAIFAHLAQDLDSEGRYLFFNAVANQLRYPNSHTHYFGVVLLHLFEKAPSEIIQEQLTR
jgi:CCR4-NOT transcription complex subunit 1